MDYSIITLFIFNAIIYIINISLLMCPPHVVLEWIEMRESTPHVRISYVLPSLKIIIITFSYNRIIKRYYHILYYEIVY